MKNHFLKLSVIILSMFASNLLAGGPCTLANVTGTIENNIVNPTVQSGVISIELTSEGGESLFEGTGGVVGRITSQNETGGSTLDHVVFLDGVNTLTTMDDNAQVTGVSGCIINVTETISTFWGTGIFKNASGEIYADGLINLCDHTTSFGLTGTVCLR